MQLIKIIYKFVRVLNNLKSYHYIKNKLCFVFVLLSFSQYAQTNLLMDAQKLCNEKKYDQAIPLTDKAVLNPETSTDAFALQMRAYAYIQAYKQKGVGNMTYLYMVDTAVVSAQKSIKYDTGKEYTANNETFIKNAAATYYKLCSAQLQDSLNNNKSELFYNKFKKYTAIVNPTFDFKQKDIEYYTAVGSIFSDKYTTTNFNQKYGDVAKTALLKVLELDSKNISANINLGVLYYNQGATLMKMMDYDVDLAQLDVIQENAKKLFKQSLPFMIKVYELDPKAERALEGLTGIYTALLEQDKAEQYRKQQEALKKK